MYFVHSIFMAGSVITRRYLMHWENLNTEIRLQLLTLNHSFLTVNALKSFTPKIQIHSRSDFNPGVFFLPGYEHCSARRSFKWREKEETTKGRGWMKLAWELAVTENILKLHNQRINECSVLKNECSVYGKVSGTEANPVLWLPTLILVWPGLIADKNITITKDSIWST